MTTSPLTVTRVFKAPVALVWAVHTDPFHQAGWLSPGNPAAYHSEMDFRIDGRHFYGMPAPDGSVMYGIQTFQEIVPLKKVVLIQSFADKDGNVAPHPMAPTWPRKMQSTTIYEDLGGSPTRLSVTWLPVEASAEQETTFDTARTGMQTGWDHQFGPIETYLTTL